MKDELSLQSYSPLAIFKVKVKYEKGLRLSAAVLKPNDSPSE